MKITKNKMLTFMILFSSTLASAGVTLQGELIDHFELLLPSKMACSLGVEGMTNGVVTVSQYTDKKSFQSLVRENSGKARLLFDLDSSALKKVDRLDMWVSQCDEPAVRAEYFAVLKDGSRVSIEGGVLDLEKSN